MKIALVHNFHSNATPSGENVAVEAELEALKGAGHDVRILRLDNDVIASRPFSRARGAVTVATGWGPSPLAELRGSRPDVLHVHNLFPFFGNAWASSTEIPIVTTLHSYRPACANGYLFRDGRVCTLCVDGHRWSGVRYGCYKDSPLATLPLALANRVDRDPLLIAAKRNLVLSERALKVFVTAGIPQAKLALDSHFVPDRLAGEPAKDYGETWLCVSRLTPEKGVDRLVAEWPSDRPLSVVGDGPLRDVVAAAGAGKQVTLEGNKSRTQVLELMRHAFGLVVPSLWYETFGLTYIEALSVGLPVLAFPPNVVADKVAREMTGVVANWGHLPDALAVADRAFERLRATCRATFESQYSEGSWVTRRLRLYEEVTG